MLCPHTRQSSDREATYVCSYVCIHICSQAAEVTAFRQLPRVLFGANIHAAVFIILQGPLNVHLPNLSQIQPSETQSSSGSVCLFIRQFCCPNLRREAAYCYFSGPPGSWPVLSSPSHPKRMQQHYTFTMNDHGYHARTWASITAAACKLSTHPNMLVYSKAIDILQPAQLCMQSYPMTLKQKMLTQRQDPLTCAGDQEPGGRDPGQQRRGAGQQRGSIAASR